MPQPLTYLHETASQTAGPYVHIGLTPRAAGFDMYRQELGGDIAGPDAPGERIRIEGTVIDGTGALVKDAIVEAWQADGAGIYAHPEDQRFHQLAKGFRGFGRTMTDFDSGLWGFDTIKPGAVMGRDGRMMAPHINVWLAARGLNIGLNTRIYFGDEVSANAADPVLMLIEQEHRRATLLATRTKEAGKTRYRFDIRLQGEDETVFLDI